MSIPQGSVTSTDYERKRSAFVALLNTNGTIPFGAHFDVIPGRKYDKVYLHGPNGAKAGRYMIDRKTETIYGVKSWAMINTRRSFGNLDFINDYDWSGYVGVPKVGTVAFVAHELREQDIAKNYKKRGRPRKVLSTTP